MSENHINELGSGESQAKRLEEIGHQLVLLLQHPDVAQRVHTKLFENEWSVMQTLGHIVEMIPFWINQCYILITVNEYLIQFGRDLDAPERVDGINHGTELELGEVIFILKQEIHAATQAIRSMSNEDRKKMGIHTRYGQMTVAEVIDRLIVTHAEEHLNQVCADLQVK
jgi:uncharacterized damage-inducible protein DinB